VTYQMPS